MVLMVSGRKGSNISRSVTRIRHNSPVREKYEFYLWVAYLTKLLIRLLYNVEWYTEIRNLNSKGFRSKGSWLHSISINKCPSWKRGQSQKYHRFASRNSKPIILEYE
jgi:hypothetical protein